MTEQEIEKHFKGFKWHHILLGFPAGCLFAHGLTIKDPEQWIGAMLIMIGYMLQFRYYVGGYKKMIEWFKQDLPAKGTAILVWTFDEWNVQQDHAKVVNWGTASNQKGTNSVENSVAWAEVPIHIKRMFYSEYVHKATNPSQP